MSLVEFAKNLVQFPFFTSTTHGCLQWVKLLSSVATSGIKGQLLMFVSSWECELASVEGSGGLHVRYLCHYIIIALKLLCMCYGTRLKKWRRSSETFFRIAFAARPLPQIGRLLPQTGRLLPRIGWLLPKTRKASSEEAEGF